MYRDLSDLDTNGLGQFGIEWDTPYGRYWHWFDTEEEREKVLQEYKKECEAENG